MKHLDRRPTQFVNLAIIAVIIVQIPVQIYVQLAIQIFLITGILSLHLHNVYAKLAGMMTEPISSVLFAI